MVLILLLLLFLSGASAYVLIELMWRGRSHISMAVAGGLAMLILYGIAAALPHGGILLKSLLGAACITLLELLTGLLVNVRLRLGVWDYSGIPGNLFGQICLPYSAAWFLLCMPVFVWLDRY
ncbi:MAG: hypothetical protein VB021_07300 [Oscillospiraceae bacterium]|nr:hypothetical protein [Oscillospiraceae bacterium]